MAKIILLGSIVILTVVFSHAQNPTSWSISSPKNIAKLKPGERATVKVQARLDSGWYIYSITQPAGGPVATQVSLESNRSFRRSGRIIGPKPKVKFDDSFGISVESYSGVVDFVIPIRVVSVPGKRSKLVVNVRFQACNGDVCLPPRTVRLTQ